MMARFKVCALLIVEPTKGGRPPSGRWDPRSLGHDLYDGTVQVNSDRPPNPELTIDGYVLTDRGDKVSSHLVGMLFGLVFAGAGVFVFTVEDSLFNRVFATPFRLIGLGLISLPLIGLWRIRRLSPGELTSAEWPLRRGSTARLTYRRSARRGNGPIVDAVAAYAKVLEVARYRQGTDTHTVTEEVARFPIQAHVLATPGALVAELRLDIPPDVPHSFHARNNRIEWWVFVEPSTAGSTVDGSSFKVQVSR